jgi:RING-type zinc-finger
MFGGAGAAALSVNLEDLRDLLTCCVCREPFSSDRNRKHRPVTPLCGHTLCYGCLKRVSSSGDYKCPTCRAPIVGDLASHKATIVITDWVRLLAPPKVSSTDGAPDLDQVLRRPLAPVLQPHPLTLQAIMMFKKYPSLLRRANRKRCGGDTASAEASAVEENSASPTLAAAEDESESAETVAVEDTGDASSSESSADSTTEITMNVSWAAVELVLGLIDSLLNDYCEHFAALPKPSVPVVPDNVLQEASGITTVTQFVLTGELREQASEATMKAIVEVYEQETSGYSLNLRFDHLLFPVQAVACALSRHPSLPVGTSVTTGMSVAMTAVLQRVSERIAELAMVQALELGLPIVDSRCVMLAIQNNVELSAVFPLCPAPVDCLDSYRSFDWYKQRLSTYPRLDAAAALLHFTNEPDQGEADEDETKEGDEKPMIGGAYDPDIDGEAEWEVKGKAPISMATHTHQLRYKPACLAMAPNTVVWLGHTAAAHPFVRVGGSPEDTLEDHVALGTVEGKFLVLLGLTHQVADTKYADDEDEADADESKLAAMQLNKAATVMGYQAEAINTLATADTVSGARACLLLSPSSNVSVYQKDNALEGGPMALSATARLAFLGGFGRFCDVNGLLEVMQGRLEETVGSCFDPATGKLTRPVEETCMHPDVGAVSEHEVTAVRKALSETLEWHKHFFAGKEGELSTQQATLDEVIVTTLMRSPSSSMPSLPPCKWFMPAPPGHILDWHTALVMAESLIERILSWRRKFAKKDAVGSFLAGDAASVDGTGAHAGAGREFESPSIDSSSLEICIWNRPACILLKAAHSSDFGGEGLQALLRSMPEVEQLREAWKGFNDACKGLTADTCDSALCGAYIEHNKMTRLSRRIAALLQERWSDSSAAPSASQVVSAPVASRPNNVSPRVAAFSFPSVARAAFMEDIEPNHSVGSSPSPSVAEAALHLSHVVRSLGAEQSMVCENLRSTALTPAIQPEVFESLFEEVIESLFGKSTLGAFWEPEALALLQQAAEAHLVAEMQKALAPAAAARAFGGR